MSDPYDPTTYDEHECLKTMEIRRMNTLRRIAVEDANRRMTVITLLAIGLLLGLAAGIQVVGAVMDQQPKVRTAIPLSMRTSDTIRCSNCQSFVRLIVAGRWGLFCPVCGISSDRESKLPLPEENEE